MSVIAKLMGLDEKPTRQQSVSKQQRVLSEDYLQKFGSIGKRSRKDSPGSKKRANLRMNKDSLPREFEPKGLGNEKDGNLHKNKKIVVLRPNLGNVVQHASGPSFLLESQSVFGWEAKKQLLERHKMNKDSQQLQTDFANLIGVKRKECWNHESVVKLPSSNTKYATTTRSGIAINTKKKFFVPNSTTVLTVSSDAEPAPKNVEYIHGDTEAISNCSMNEGCSSHLSDVSSEQDLAIISHADGSVSSNCVHIDEEHSDVTVEMYQRSPNSVLETPFGEDSSTSSECCGSSKTDLHGLWMQLQLLKAESEENVSKPKTVTSSDDETSTCTNQNAIPIILSGAKESRDFSFLVDVLNESGFENFKRWHTSECMAGPSVFGTLEKKYGKQELWHRSDRRLLFDRINLGMAEIVRPRVDIKVCSKPLRRKMRSMLRRDVIEEELWALLLDQGKGVDDGVSEKAVGRGLWFDPVDELDSLMTEIEMFLFDGLVLELVSV
ncbi:uncharacterized protein LOC143588616 [Bidens hawaiensis]|uniref:uncharacterized protein LOC143588616 n=1 Tax=Bidens hawaiensis TaxID=980011 RepID=UPI00404A7613